MLDWIEVLPHAPPWLEHAAAWVTAIMSLLALLGWALDAALPALRKRAESTESKADDAVVAWLSKAVAVLSLISAVVPRPRLGERRDDDRG